MYRYRLGFLVSNLCTRIQWNTYFESFNRAIVLSGSGYKKLFSVMLIGNGFAKSPNCPIVQSINSIGFLLVSHNFDALTETNNQQEAQQRCDIFVRRGIGSKKKLLKPSSYLRYSGVRGGSLLAQ